jgi:hypothetical protein
MIVLVLQEPVSKNRLYSLNRPGFTKSGRRKKRFRYSPQYEAWCKTSGREVLAQGANRNAIHGPYTVRLELSTRSRKDADGCLAGVMDFLVRSQLTDDDRHCRKVEAIKLDDVPVGTCRVIVDSWGLK